MAVLDVDFGQFINHDPDNPSGKLVWGKYETNKEGVRYRPLFFVALRPLLAGDELTVNYGKGYKTASWSAGRGRQVVEQAV